MPAAAWITLVVGGLSLLLNVIALAIGYGVLRGTVQALASRVTAMEAEVKAVGELKTDVAVVTAMLTGLSEQFKDFRAAVRWMEKPPPYEPSDLKRPGSR